MQAKKAIAIVELTTVSAGISAADTMAKQAHIELLEAGAVCPGKYLIVIAGELSAVMAGVDAATAKYADKLISAHILGNPHESVYAALYGKSHTATLNALGVVETLDAATAVFAADAAVKTAIVELIEVKLAKGLCGKSFFTLTGNIAAVTAAVERAAAVAEQSGMLLDTCIVARPDEGLGRFVL